MATLISFSGVIATDTFAFLGGKVNNKAFFLTSETALNLSLTIEKLQAFGRTPLTSISPKKTWEGTFAGFVGCIVITILLSNSLSWPRSLFRLLSFLSLYLISVSFFFCDKKTSVSFLSSLCL